MTWLCIDANPSPRSTGAAPRPRKGCSQVVGASLRRCHYGCPLHHPFPRAGMLSHPPHCIPIPGVHRCKHQAPCKDAVPGVSGVVQPGGLLPSNPSPPAGFPWRWRCCRGGLGARQMLNFTKLHPCPKARREPAGTGLQAAQELLQPKAGQELGAPWGGSGWVHVGE